MMNKSWLEVSEYISLAASGVGSAVAVVSGQLVYGFLPVSVSLFLNLANRWQAQQKAQQNIKAAVNLAQWQVLGEVESLRYQLSTRSPEEQQNGLEARLTKLAKDLRGVEAQIQAVNQHLETFVPTADPGMQAEIEQLKMAIAQLSQGSPAVAPPETAEIVAGEILTTLNLQIDQIVQRQNQLEEAVTPLEGAIAQLSQNLMQMAVQLEALTQAGMATVEPTESLTCLDEPKAIDAIDAIDAIATNTAETVAEDHHILALHSPPPPEFLNFQAQTVSKIESDQESEKFRDRTPQKTPFWQSLQTFTGHTAWVNCVTISPDGQTLVSGSSDNTIKIWQVQTGELVRTLSWHLDAVYSVAISPDGQTLASSSWDKSIKIWSLRTGRLKCDIQVDSSVYSVAISPDGQTLVSGRDDQTIKLWKLQTGDLLGTLTSYAGSVLSVAISANHQMLAGGSWGTAIQVWDLQTRTLIRTLSGHSSSVKSVAFTPDSQTLASGSADGTIKLWEPITGKLICTLAGHTKPVNAIAISADGQFLASASDDTTVKIWQLGQGKENPDYGRLVQTLTAHTKAVKSVAFSPCQTHRDEYILASSGWDNKIKIWQWQS